jgi:hemolysin activation/secretion protein
MRLWTKFLIGVLAVFGASAVAAETQPDRVGFEIRRFVLEGNTLLPVATAEQLLAPHQGSNKDFADIQRALEALEAAYRGLGYGVVQVTLPEQNITLGEIRFVIIEPPLGKITIEGNRRFGAENIRRSVSALVEGSAPNSRAISRSLQIANENPAKQTQVLLRAGASETSVDAAIKVTEDKFWKAAVTLDNSGTSNTGTWRLSTSYQHANLFEREVNNDVGQRVTLEVSSPDLATLLDLKSLRARLAAFYDWGHVSHNHPLPGETLGKLISSLGIGIRLAASSNYSARIDTARVLQAGGDQRRGDWKVHALFSLLLF